MTTTISYPADSVDCGVKEWQHNGLGSLLHHRELRNYEKPSRKVQAVYGRSEWVDNLDIVNELSGHGGCVNALSWSKSGRLLASGSDDKHLNIQKYQPDDSNAQFTLATTVATGHSANIFSVKFMPHSNDQTVITCAGDGEVRVFDLEAGGPSVNPSTAADRASNARRRGRGIMPDGVRYLTDGNTNCRVYRSHGDRVKRIVTESSPFLFLSCSEDGEVRQWDLRLPSSSYPRPRRAYDSSVPPPLISYKPFQIDLHTISCSPSQPYYIALGGSHLHCFLHDRRMLGRNMTAGSGQTPSTPITDTDEDLMGKATQCVRKFAPEGRQKMSRSDNGHITACKISDAHPNELIASWSGEHIYSFDIIRSPDASERVKRSSVTSNGKAKNTQQSSPELKRKRGTGSTNSLSQQGGHRAGSRPRTESPVSEDHGMAVRVQYGNGQSEDIPVREHHEESAYRSPQQRTADDLARRATKVASHILDHRAARPSSLKDVTGWSSSFTSVLGYCASTLPEMRQIHTSWRYPVDTSQPTLTIHRKLRQHRESAIRFVQAAGVTARALGGRLQSASSTNPALATFEQIHVSDADGPDLDPREQFQYDFLRAIFLWLDSGIGALLNSFSKDAAPNGRLKHRFPVPADADIDAIDEQLIPYLLNLASDRKITNVDVSRFEVDENQVVFRSEQEAVREFGEAIKKPFADLSSDFTGHDPDTQQRSMAIRFWGMTVARGVLKNAWEGLNFAIISRAFGGLGEPDPGTSRQEPLLQARVSGVDPDEDDEENLAGASVQIGADDEPIAVSDLVEAFAEEAESSDSNTDHSHEQDDEDDEEDGDDNDNDPAIIDSDDDAESSDGSDDDDGGYEFGFPGRLQKSAFNRRKLWSSVEAEVPCVPHTRSYQGHCNVKTVKDVNFYGLDDEFVVSGSDDGNLFIWDRKTSKLLNILEGDGEVVNVVQGHPYEPMLAVSGIDDTIKIFSPDARARQAARLGRDVEAADSSTFSSISWPARVRGRRVPQTAATTVTSEPAEAGESQSEAASPEEDDDNYVAPNGLASRRKIDEAYQIMTENDRTRQGGNQEAYITASDLLAMILGGMR
ncbi:WD domain-containing protein 48 [Elsinoe fawcettii]|nr:WD domain-containing protein 48 [Elsinoe fawcettii]